MREININIEGYNVNGICVGCLNYGRKMFYEEAVKDCFKLLGNIDVQDGITIQVCWECLAAVRNIVRFQNTILSSYEVLSCYSSQHTFLNSPCDLSQHAESRLNTHNISESETVDVMFDNDIDKHTDVIEIKIEIEDGDEKNDFLIAESDEIPLENLTSDFIDKEIKDEPKFYMNNDYSMDLQSDYEPDDNVQLSLLKKQKKKRSRLKHKKTLMDKDAKLNEKLLKKLKNLPQNSVEIAFVSEFEMLELRKADVLNSNFVKLRFKCDRCILGFNTEKLMIDHNNGKHTMKDKKSIQCDICQCYLLTKDCYRQHRDSHLAVYACKHCPYKSCSKKNISNHLNENHAGISDDIICKSCGENFESKSKLSYHKNICKQEKPQCDCCGKVFANKITLKYHLKILPVNKTENKPAEKLVLPCKGCGKIFYTKKSYRAHVVIHNGLQYPCSICGKQFQWKRNLARHMRNHKDKAEGALHECKQCGKRFSSRDCYNNHMRFSKRHVSENKLNHVCGYCGKKFATKWCMVDHIDWDHLKNIKYQCTTCLKPFKTAKILVAHVNNIHGNKNKEPDGQHLCEICGKSYKTEKRLKGHVWAMHTHRSNSKSYKCQYCPATFTWQTSIYKHLRVMHEWPRKGGVKPKSLPPKKEIQYNIPDMDPTSVATFHQFQ